MFRHGNGCSRSRGPDGGDGQPEAGGGLPGRFKFSKLLPTCYFVLVPIQHRICVFCVFVGKWAKAHPLRSPMTGGSLASGTGQGAHRVSEILSKIQRDVVQAGEPDGGFRAAGRSVRSGAMGMVKRVPAAFASGLAGRAARWGRSAVNSGASKLLLLGAAGPLCVDRPAFNNTYRGAPGGFRGVRSDRLLRPASLGGKMAIRPFSP